MAQTATYSSFIRPPGSPVYGPTVPLMIPRRPSSSRTGSRAPMPVAESWDASSAEARRQATQVLALIRAAGVTVIPEIEQPRSDPHAVELVQSLQQLESRLEERERSMNERDFRLSERQRDLAEMEVLLQAREKLLAASKKRRPARVALSDEERTALVALKGELDRQEALLLQSRESIREREKFLDASETCLFQKVQQHQEKETELEQREEELVAREQALWAKGNSVGDRSINGSGIAANGTTGAIGAGGVVETKRMFDEFNE